MSNHVYTAKDGTTMILWCECMCHTKGMEVRHMMPCCDVTYQKYINDDKSIDTVTLEEQLEKAAARHVAHQKRREELENQRNSEESQQNDEEDVTKYWKK